MQRIIDAAGFAKIAVLVGIDLLKPTRPEYRLPARLLRRLPA